MRIVVDENVVGGSDAFATLGDVTVSHGREIDKNAIRDAVVLVTRSITKITADLLEGTSVRFVGSATIGTDHIDIPYLESAGITWFNAPGCNANSVSEYITAALIEIAIERRMNLSEKKIGIVGVGNVGAAVAKKAAALGMDIVLNDPPLHMSSGDEKYRPIDEILECDIVTLHVPLTVDGPYATKHMVSDEFLDRMRTGAIVINTSRGSVVDGRALKHALESGKIGACVLDVWENEPDINTHLMANCAIATAHIAGHSVKGKVNGTRQVYEALCAHLGETPSWTGDDFLPPPHDPVEIPNGVEDIDALAIAVRAAYSIQQDDEALRKIARPDVEDRGKYFDELRKNYPARIEFDAQPVLLADEESANTKALVSMGFQVVNG